ncbi:MAG TPA: addiction module protein [Terriglobia bacterium]|nr:addiction module protein [Terriglobia bacterium]
MSKQGAQLLEEALSLPPAERAQLAEQILTSLDFGERSEIDALWAQEAEERLDAFERGQLKAIPAADVFRDIKRSGR